MFTNFENVGSFSENFEGSSNKLLVKILNKITEYKEIFSKSCLRKFLKDCLEHY